MAATAISSASHGHRAFVDSGLSAILLVKGVFDKINDLPEGIWRPPVHHSSRHLPRLHDEYQKGSDSKKLMITIIDYKAGNLTSVQLAFAALGVAAKITDDPAAVLAAERVVFPGVGAAGASMTHLHQLGLAEAIETKIAQGVPFLCICVGMQVLFDASEEDGGTPCLGIVPGTVKRFIPPDPQCKIPHMGWNRVYFQGNHPLLAGIEDESEFYFVHSYYPAPAEADCILGETDYAAVRFASIVGRDNFLATQFHPEKSGRIGLKLLENFSQWEPGLC